MGTYDTMKAALKMTGLYTLDGSTDVDCELQAYAAVLDPLRADLERLQTESFAATAEDYGQRYREMALQLPSAVTCEESRKAIFTLGAVGPNDCGKAALEKILAGIGVQAEVTEDITGGKVKIHITSVPYGGTDLWKSVVARFLPAHLNVEWN